jgi:hypothetical protein
VGQIQAYHKAIALKLFSLLFIRLILTVFTNLFGLWGVVIHQNGMAWTVQIIKLAAFNGPTQNPDQEAN